MASRKLEVVITGDASSLERALGKTQKSARRLQKGALLAGGAIVAGLAVGLKKSVDAAMESEKAQARLNASMKSARVSHEKYGSAIQKNIEKTSRLAALDDEDLSDAFSKLLRTTKDVTKATEGMNLAADIARTRNVSLEAAAKAVERAYNGSTMSLSRYGVAVEKSSKNAELVKQKIKEQREAMKGLKGAALEAAEAELTNLKGTLEAAKARDKEASALNALSKAQKQFAGGAEAYGKTAAGANERLQVAVENLQEKIGTKLLPILARMAEDALKVISWMEKNWPRLQQAVGPTIENIRRIVNNALEDMRKFWDQHGERIIAIVTFIFNTLKTTFENAFRVIRGIIDVAMGLLTGDWRRAWDGVKNIVGGIFDQIGHMLRTAITVLAKIGSAIGTAVKNAIVDGISGLGKALWQAIKDAWDYVKDKIKDLNPLKLPSIDLPFFGGGGGDPGPGSSGGRTGDAHQTGGYNLMGASPVMAPFAAAASAFGLAVTSGLRPGAVTKHGTPSDHGVGKALDLAGSAGAMASFFKSLLGNPAVKQAFYDPLGSIFGGKWSSYKEGGHSDHVHVATYDRGGVLRPGWTLAYNGTGMNEYVSKGGGGVSVTVNVPGGFVGSEQLLADVVRREVVKARRRGDVVAV